MVGFPGAVERMLGPARSADSAVSAPHFCAPDLRIGVQSIGVLAQATAELGAGVGFLDDRQIDVTPLAVSGRRAEDFRGVSPVRDPG